jgi:hypothetical protein
MVRAGGTSRASAANLFGITRTFHDPSPLGKRNTSGGVRFSFPGQKGQFGDSENLRPRLPVHNQLFGTLGSFGGDDNPLLGEKVLAKFRHSSSPYLRNIKSMSA